MSFGAGFVSFKKQPTASYCVRVIGGRRSPVASLSRSS